MWITVEETANLLNISDRTIRRNIEAYETKEVNSGKNTKKFLIRLESLPLEIQKKYYLSTNSLDSTEEDTEQEIDLRYTLGELKELHGTNFEQHMESALKKQEIVLRVLKESNKKACLAELAKQDINDRSIRRWTKAYAEQGFLGLIRKPKEKGAAKLTTKAINFIRGCYLQAMEPEATHVYRLYLRKAEEEGWEKVSYATVKRAIDKIPKAEFVLARKGEKAYNAQCMPKITRDYSDLLINEYWVGDGHTLAVWTPKKDKIVRYTFSAWMDMRSRAMVGWCIAKHSSSEVIAAGLKSGIERFGLPGHCYMDNGKDYRSEYLNAGMAESRYKFLQDYKGVFASLDIGTKFATPFYAWAKPIERYFRTFSSKCSRYMTGFCGESIDRKPHNLKKNDILLKDVSIETLAKAIEAYQEAYNNTPHSALAGKTPMEIVGSTEFYRHDKPTEEELDMLMLKVVGTRKITDSGIRLFNTWYWNDAVVNFYDKEAVVRYDPHKIGELYVYVDGELKFKAYNKKLLSMNAGEEDIREWRKLQANARKATKEAIAAYEIEEDEVRRMVLSEFIQDEETVNALVPDKKEVTKDGKRVTRMNQTVKQGKEKQRMDVKASKEVEEVYDYFGAIGDEYIKSIG